MHIVHQGDTKTPDADVNKHPLGHLGVMGVMFDSRSSVYANTSAAQVKAIDMFFDNLMYEKIDDPSKSIIADEIALGELMAVLNLKDRFIYSGSLTTPPCYQKIFFNVLSTIYPIKKYHIDYYVNVVKKRAAADTDSKTKGNWRVPRDPTAAHKLILVKGDPPASSTVE
jgi:carbonic anhydrase